MRAAVSLLLAVLLVGPIPLAFARDAPAHVDPPRDARPHLMPPRPGVQTWPSGTRQGNPILPPSPVQTTGTVRVLVLLVDFTDVAPLYTGAYFTAFFNDASPGARSLQAYYQEVSLGALTVQATVITTWFDSVHPMADYGADSAKPPDDANGDIYRLVTETVRLADPIVDFAPFDTDGDGVVDHLVIVHAGDGQEAGGSSDLIWSHRWAVYDADPALPGTQTLIADGVQIFGYTMVAESSPVGVVAHEFGHDLGLPDLYDTDGSSDGAGLWDIMAGGSWNGVPAGTSPADMSAWSRIRLGWITPTSVTTALIGTSIAQAETSGAGVFRLSIPGASPLEYFLVENREPYGFDAALPGSGLLIWHVDDALSSNEVDTHRLLDLLEADEGLTGDRPTDAGDPWHDTANGWGPDTNPDSRAYSGSDTGWRVRDVSASGATMTATIASGVTRDLAVSAIRVPLLEAVGTRVNVWVDVRNDGAQASDVRVDIGVYLDSVATASLIVRQTFFRPAVAAQTTTAFSLNFTPTVAGRYLVIASLVGAADDIPTNDERAAHVLVAATIPFRDAVEAGAGGWTLDGSSTDAHRWQIVNDTDPDGAAHSRTHAWRFGYVNTLFPNLFPPEWHTLTSPSINVTAGPTFLIFFGRYDLTGRTVPVLPIGSNDTDDAYVEVSVAGGPWIALVHYSGRDLTWRGISFDLTANITGPTTLRIRFRVSANVLANAGGWWIDDVTVASSGLGRAVLLLGASGPYQGAASGTVRVGVKVANVGDVETVFRLDAALPAGWTATLAGEPPGPLSGHLVRLAPDNDASLRVDIVLPWNAASGALVSVPINATAVGDANANASLVVQVRLAGFSIELLLAAGSIAAIALATVVIFGLRRLRRPPV
ncbi:MAG TPA: M6 family metalloprotease domain-containing protein [Thermoplasmata archaeon]